MQSNDHSASQFWRDLAREFEAESPEYKLVWQQSSPKYTGEQDPEWERACYGPNFDDKIATDRIYDRLWRIFQFLGVEASNAWDSWAQAIIQTDADKHGMALQVDHDNSDLSPYAPDIYLAQESAQLCYRLARGEVDVPWLASIVDPDHGAI